MHAGRGGWRCSGPRDLGGCEDDDGQRSAGAALVVLDGGGRRVRSGMRRARSPSRTGTRLPAGARHSMAANRDDFTARRWRADRTARRPRAARGRRAWRPARIDGRAPAERSHLQVRQSGFARSFSSCGPPSGTCGAHRSEGRDVAQHRSLVEPGAHRYGRPIEFKPDGYPLDSTTADAHDHGMSWVAS